jgi:hypothetical protein
MGWKEFFKPSIAVVIIFLALFIGSSFFSFFGATSGCATFSSCGFPFTWFKSICVDNRNCTNQTTGCSFEPEIIPMVANIAIYILISLIIIAVYRKFKIRKQQKSTNPRS